jgi:hypothetical protein
MFLYPSIEEPYTERTLEGPPVETPRGDGEGYGLGYDDDNETGTKGYPHARGHGYGDGWNWGYGDFGNAKGFGEGECGLPNGTGHGDPLGLLNGDGPGMWDVGDNFWYNITIISIPLSYRRGFSSCHSHFTWNQVAIPIAYDCELI